MNKLTICIAGKNDIAVNVLEYLIKNNKNRYNLCATYNKTEKGVDSFQRSFKKYVEKNGIREYKLDELYEIENLMFLSVEYDRIVKPCLFKDARLYNIHFSLLPAYKGVYTSAIPILNGESISVVTLHKIDNGIDTGEIIAQKIFDINRDDTCRDLYFKYTKNGTELVLDNIEKIIMGTEKSIPQSFEGSTYYGKSYINYKELVINLNTTAEMIRRQINAYSFQEHQMPKVYGYEIIDTNITNIRSRVPAGSVIMETDTSIMIASIDYNVILYKNQSKKLFEACKEGNFSAVKEICSIKRHANMREIHGWTPLMVATYNGHIEIVKWLILNGADIFAVNYNGTNLLMYAKEAWLRTSARDLFDLYVSLGLDIERCDYYGKNVYDYLDNSDREKLLKV